ncbi:MAG: protein kinase [Labilithrix sp.]|nr:protein kinase [Labilithrix sp.]
MTMARVKPGDVLGGKYKVERILGAGGMGVVVAAKHVDLGQRVALKFMLKEAMADPSHAERFLREAKSAVQLKSLHTARVLDVGRLKNDEPFMVMEYLDGRDLDAELQARGPLPPHVAVDYILQASEALAEAHGLGMIHRDVKLKNMFLTAGVDGRPLVKMLDFGLAKTLGSHGDVSLTATNSVFGSPQYMSPEQMRSAKDVDVRSDIWSIGVCLYELLTGRVPFDAQGVAEICAMVLKDPVPAPSQFVQGLPVDLEAAVLRCLEKDVTRRFQSVAELAFALQSYAPDEASARRILHVMQTVQKADHATIVTSGPSDLEGGAKTMNAWDSGQPARKPAPFLTRPQLVGAFVGVALLGIVGAGGITLAVRKRSARAVPTALVAESPAPSAATDPPSSATGAPGASPVPEPPSAPDAPAADSSEPHAAAASSGPSSPTASGTSTAKPVATAGARPRTPHAPATAKATASPSATPPKKSPGGGAEYM